MNQLTIIGNAVKDPELRTTPTGKTVCTFTVAVNRRKANPDGSHDADFFRVSAWDGNGENCAKYVTKGKKVCVVGAVSVNAFTNSKGEASATLEVNAKEVEFLSPRQEQPKVDAQTGYMQVEPDDIPY